MALPLFFSGLTGSAGQEILLDEENSRHIAQVLRMQPGERILLTNGEGHVCEAEIRQAGKKQCVTTVLSSGFSPRPAPALCIAISLLKNTGRFEWFLEKATEFGTAVIIPLITARTGKHQVRTDRLRSICRNAMLQSNQHWLPDVHEPTPFDQVLRSARQEQKLIAYCSQGHRPALTALFDPSLNSHIVLIGPEGDFTDAEVQQALSLQFQAVSLGPTRLRTETAGLYAAAVCRRPS